ncbi:MAG: hypothetical protein K6T37_06190 [Acidothermus cellulolyticus]|nr:hypothetical protein [Acidothermus cellulolyticus]
MSPVDVIFSSDREGRWRGAASDHSMTHLCSTEGIPHCGDRVTDDEYAGKNSK